MRLISWNVNGIRAAVKKNFKASLESMQPDVLCVQETKAQDDQVEAALADIRGLSAIRELGGEKRIRRHRHSQ